jgi:SAM-dependent methyltransferase
VQVGVPTQRATTTCGTLELLSPDILDEHRATVERLRGLADTLDIGLGWHYLLDLPWILSHATAGPGSTVVDAGAGMGVLQWYLAMNGCKVISVDRLSRKRLPEHFRSRFDVQGQRSEDLDPAPRTSLLHLVRRPLARARRLLRLAGAIRRGYRPRRAAHVSGPGPLERSGQVFIYNQDLRHLVDIPDGSIDAVVSVSALEHNHPQELPAVVAELMRVLKPGGRLVATVGASSDRDWFHEPSKGWCFSEATLRRIFDIPESVKSNYAEYDHILGDLRANAELRKDLAAHYFESGDNGMPWGRWDPRYLSVGVCKVKPWLPTEN